MKEQKKKYDIEVMKNGIIPRAMKVLNKKDKMYGLEIMREASLSNSESYNWNNMINLGYIKRVDSKGDRRKYYALTDKGKVIIDELMKIEIKLYGGIR